ncbi:hypothetical protein B0T17DRAFT_613049 [Bombardia bombarda]|uniref:Uncharacterized protein n=1 Tax=Bombardia bombarda TaxID=252184 RepID=A0AA40CF73_9PEZI|nr:hypothetical protein B0T17DRAFT_613049 [Bombardia bombarda]
MLAAHRDQENRVVSQAGSSKPQLQARTPGVRYPKTPLKVPLNDENMIRGFGGKSALRTKGNNENVTTIGKGGNGLGKSGKSNFATPAEPRTARAPLGNKTTNAKAKAAPQTGGVKNLVRDFEKTTVKPTSARPKQAAPQIESSKLEVHTDKDPLEDEDIEYAPPRTKEIPYESDVCPDGVLTFEGLKPENLFKGYYQYYFNHVDDNGLSLKEREMEEQRQRDFERGDEQIRRDMEEFDWSIGDVPGSKDLCQKTKKDTAGPEAAAEVKTAQRPVLKTTPSTIASRKAASALAMSSKAFGPTQGTTQIKMNKIRPAPAVNKGPSFLLAGRKQLQPAPRNPLTERATAIAASRSTLGYSRGRSALSAVHGRNTANISAVAPVAPPEPPVKTPHAFTRTASTASSGSDCTITPARFAQSLSPQKELKKLEFLSIFDVDEEDDGNLNLASAIEFDDLDDDFQLPTDF